MTRPLDPATRAVRAGLESDDVTGAVVPPIHLTSTFAFSGLGEKRKYDYTRSGNPTRDLLADALAVLEGGAGAIVTATGMAAITVVGHLLPAGSRIVAAHDCYGGTYRLFSAWQRRGELRVDFPGGAGGSRTFFVDDGFAQMVGNHLTILAASAIDAEKLTESEAQAELSAANARRTEGESESVVARIRKERNRATAKLRVARSFAGKSI